MKKLMIVCFLGLAWAGCNKDEGNGTYSSYDDVVDAGGGTDDPPVPTTEILNSSLADEEQEGEPWRCTTTTLKVGYSTGGQGGFPQFNPNASVIYPGSLLQGKSLSKATPDVIAVERAGGTISIDILDGSPRSSFDVTKVTKSSIGDASNAIIAASTGTIPANMEFSYEKVQSKQQMAAALKVDYHNAFAEIEGKLKFSSDKEYNRTVVNLVQSYYTMSYDIPTSLDKVFASSVTPQDLAKYVGPGNPATYISDVTYGRIYMLLVETTSTEKEMDAAVNASFSGVVAGGGVDAKVSKLSTLSNLKVKLFAFGGEATSTLLTIGNAGDLQALTALLAEGTDIRTGKPISYVVRSVYNNQIVKVGLNTEYDVTNCEPLNPNGAPPPYTASWAGLLLTFGPIGSITTLDGHDKFMLVDKEGTHYLISEDGKFEGPFHIDELGIEPCTLEDIGSSAYVEGSSTDNVIQFFDTRGINQAYYFADAGTWGQAKSVAEWGEGLFPFNLNGISAAMNYGVEEDPILPGYYTNVRAFFEANSLRYCLFHNQSSSGFDNPQHMNGFVLNHPFPFGGVAAATGFTLGQQRFRLLFNEDGDRYVIAVEAFEDYYIGPFRL
jgi:thiol-activated cytolysin